MCVRFGLKWINASYGVDKTGYCISLLIYIAMLHGII